jgi:hypothetical protein
MRRHLGEWISIHAHAERVPLRFTVSITLGELPEGWSRAGRHARTWSALVGLVLIAPFVLLLAASALHNLGFGAPYAWLSSSTFTILAGTISLFIGIPVAIAMNLWRIARLGWRRHAGALDGLIALEFAPLHLAVVLIGLVAGGLFVGHLAPDSYACINGVRTAC